MEKLSKDKRNFIIFFVILGLVAAVNNCPWITNLFSGDTEVESTVQLM